MRAIVRNVNSATMMFIAECPGGACALFEVQKGGFPFGGEYVRWNDDGRRVTMVMGESSGTHVISQMRYPITRAEAEQALLQATREGE